MHVYVSPFDVRLGFLQMCVSDFWRINKIDVRKRVCDISCCNLQCDIFIRSGIDDLLSLMSTGEAQLSTGRNVTSSRLVLQVVRDASGSDRCAVSDSVARQHVTPCRVCSSNCSSTTHLSSESQNGEKNLTTRL